MTRLKIDEIQVVKARNELAEYLMSWRDHYHPQVVIAAVQHMLATLIAAAPEPWREITMREIIELMPENVRHEVAQFDALKEELAANDRKH